jgi:hypothetical protein
VFWCERAVPMLGPLGRPARREPTGPTSDELATLGSGVEMQGNSSSLAQGGQANPAHALSDAGRVTVATGAVRPLAASCCQASTTPRRPLLASSGCARSQDRGDVILRAFAGGPVGSDRSQFVGQSGAHKKRRPTNRQPSQEYQALHGSLRSFLVQSDGRLKASSACNFKEARSRSPPQVVPQCPLSPGIGPVLRKCMLWANVVIT